MKIKSLALLLIITIFSLSVQAQEKGMKFEHNSSWKEILAKAKAENKYIFVDCYTTWCGPCKYMSANIFPLETVGKFYNEKFINAKFQIDTARTDNDDAKAQYADAAFMAKEYKIRAYPTYLFFNPDGELVHRELGSCNAEQFIAKGENAINQDKQYYTMLKKYQAGQKDSEFLKKLIFSAISADENEAVSKISKEYFATQSDLLTEDNMRLVYEITRTPKDTGLTLMLNNLSKFETVIDKERLHTSLKRIILISEFIDNGKFDPNKIDAMWEVYSKNLHAKYPLFAEDVLLDAKVLFLPMVGKWDDYATAVDKYLEHNSLSDENLNSHAWLMFQQCDDPKVLNQALAWSKKSFEGKVKMSPEYIDTYANILHKIGKTKEAIEWETKAQTMAEGDKRNAYQEVINKMKKGEKTW